MAVIEQQAGILLPTQVHRHLVETLVGLAPIGGGPALVERVDRAIALRQEGVPQLRRLGIERGQADLVVDLPADHGGLWP
jgi:hypothetical protein